MEDKVKIFIYGSLKTGYSNHNILKRRTQAKFLNLGKTTIKYPLYYDNINEHYPILLNKEGKGNYVHGEIWEVTSKDIDRLNEFEGSPTLFKLEDIQVNNEVMKAYFYQDKHPYKQETEQLIDIYIEEEK